MDKSYKLGLLFLRMLLLWKPEDTFVADFGTSMPFQLHTSLLPINVYLPILPPHPHPDWLDYHNLIYVLFQIKQSPFFLFLHSKFIFPTKVKEGVEMFLQKC